MIFDTLKLSEELQEGGDFTLAQANKLARTLNKASVDHLATKDDLRASFAELRTEIEALKGWLMLRMGGMFMVAIGILHFWK